MDEFNVENFLYKSEQKIGPIKKVEISYGQVSKYQAKLYITAYNGKELVKFDDYHCEPAMDFIFGENFDDCKYQKSRVLAKQIRHHIKSYYPNIEVHCETKCSFAWFGR